MKFASVLLFIAPICCGNAIGQIRQLDTDWLVNPAPFKAIVTENKSTHELVLENGLARRVIRLAPNAATVDLQNLVTGEHVLRAIAPEARITVDGVPFDIGGLQGQPVSNYIKAEWLDTLRADPLAYRFAGCAVGPTEARFPWQKRLEWMSRDLPWPPPGKHVVLYFQPPDAPPVELAAPVLMQEDFSNQTSVGPGWKFMAAKGFDRASFCNESKAGEIMAAEAMAACAQHAWPQGSLSVEVSMDSGDDQSGAWGPGLALVVRDRVIRFITMPGSGNYEADGKAAGAFDRSKPCRLRARIEGQTVVFEAAQGSDVFKIIGTASCPTPPTALRVGKVGLDGSGEDAGADKSPIRCHILKVTWRSAEQRVATVPRADLPAIEVHYEIYDGIPLFSKWLVVKNNAAKTVRLNRFVAEELRFAEPESTVSGNGTSDRNEYPNLYVESDYNFGSSNPSLDNPAVHVGPDADYNTQVNYNQKAPCLLRCEPSLMGPDADIEVGKSFESFRVFDLLLDSTERERRTLAQRRMYRTIAPWTVENPLMFHKTSSDPASIRDAIDQASQAGFEMIIMSFSSGFNFESTDPAYIASYKQLADEAHAKGIALGGYSLLASRGAADSKDNTQGQSVTYGVMPCLGSLWGHYYLEHIRDFCAQAGLGVFENDGSYPGDRCAATDHPYHHGLADSQWVQWRAITDLYKWCTGHGVYLNIPDWYFLAGSTKTFMGYRETDWSLPRAEQELIERQNMYDGTWTKTASMGWMFVPLSEYHGGGEAATIEPLHTHLDHYEGRLADLLGYGVQACWRGPRLYDTDETRAVVQKWVTFYKTHRQVLDGDIIHLQRANGLDWDGILHVNPQGAEKGMAFFYNPLGEDIVRQIRVPLHYTGLTGEARVSVDGGPPATAKLDREESVRLTINIPAHKRTWVLFTE